MLCIRDFNFFIYTFFHLGREWTEFWIEQETVGEYACRTHLHVEIFSALAERRATEITAFSAYNAVKEMTSVEFAVHLLPDTGCDKFSQLKFNGKNK